MRALARLGTPTADVGEALRGFYLIDIDAGVRARAARLAPTGSGPSMPSTSPPHSKSAVI